MQSQNNMNDKSAEEKYYGQKVNNVNDKNNIHNTHCKRKIITGKHKMLHAAL